PRVRSRSFFRRHHQPPSRTLSPARKAVTPSKKLRQIRLHRLAERTPTYSTSCLRRNRFSADSAEADRNVRQKKIRASTNTLEAQHRNRNRAERLDIADRIAQS